MNFSGGVGSDSSGAIGIGATAQETNAAIEEAFGHGLEGTMNIGYIATKASFDSNFDVSGTLLVDVEKVASNPNGRESDAIISVNGNFALGENGKIRLMNFDRANLASQDGVKQLNIVSSTSGAVTLDNKVDFGTIFYGDSIEVDQEGNTATGLGDINGGVVSFAPNAKALELIEGRSFYSDVVQALEDVDFGNDVLADAVIFGLNDDYAEAYEAAQDAGLTDEAAIADFIGDRLDETVFESAQAAQMLALNGGAFSVAADINNEITASLDRRTTIAEGIERQAQGLNVWADIIGANNQADELYGGSGYEADIYGAVLGADVQVTNGAFVGLALSIGQADANSVGLSSRIDNDVDFYGVSLYASHQIGAFNGKADIGYVRTENDLSTELGAELGEDLNADIFTAGVGAEYLVKVGAVSVVPHIGVRWTNIDMDDSKLGTSYDKMNLFQAPIGVTFAGAFEQGDWTFAPSADLSFIPAFGDKDAVASVDDFSDSVRVVDAHPFQASLGVSAQNGDWTIGLRYGLTAGSDERLNNRLNASVRYAF